VGQERDNSDIEMLLFLVGKTKKKKKKGKLLYMHLKNLDQHIISVG